MKPAQVLDSQLDLLSRMQSPLVRKLWATHFEMDFQTHQQSASALRDAAGWPLNASEDFAKGNAAGQVASLHAAVRDAYAYWVTPDMSLLVEHAATQLDNSDRFSKQLAPSRSGIVRFDRPISFTDVRSKRMLLSWVVWGPIIIDARTRNGRMEPQEGTAMFMFNDHFDDPDEIAAELFETRKMRDWMMKETGRWGCMGAETLYDGMKMGPAFIEPNEGRRARILADGDLPHAVTNPLRIMHAYWMLLGQRLVSTTEETVPKTIAKRARHMGLPPRVTVIYLREVSTHRNENESIVEWSHRWVVKGHWRWQRYGPQRHEHVYGAVRIDGRVMIRECDNCDARVERIWIAPFIKGPDGKPLVVSDKVYALVR